MSLRRHALLLAATLPSACSAPPPAAEDNQIGSIGAGAVESAPNQSLPADATIATGRDAKAETSYAGKWIGVEGMVLTVTARPGGGVAIENQWDLDHQGSFAGSVVTEGLRWSRNGEVVTASPSDGNATGLKYLAGKKDCLTVRPGEGYCRD